MRSKKVRHILSLSGGKDSTALAIYLRDRIPDLEYVFCDTEKELPETYAYLDKLEVCLNRPIIRLKHDGRDFEHWLTIYGNYLPSSQARWCTRHLKIQPFEEYVGNDLVLNYIGIRYDEQRDGYITSKAMISTKSNIKPIYPFKEDRITKRTVREILEAEGLGLPSYYRWRSRSGCYFCFFQQKIEWIGLLENHPHLFEEAKRYEKYSQDGKTRFTWNSDESLEEMERPERIAEIKAEHMTRMARVRERLIDRPMIEVVPYEDEVLENALEQYEYDAPCLICQL